MSLIGNYSDIKYNIMLLQEFKSVHQDEFVLDTDSGFRLVQDVLLCREAY